MFRIRRKTGHSQREPEPARCAAYRPMIVKNIARTTLAKLADRSGIGTRKPAQRAGTTGAKPILVPLSRASRDRWTHEPKFPSIRRLDGGRNTRRNPMRVFAFLIPSIVLMCPAGGPAEAQETRDKKGIIVQGGENRQTRNYRSGRSLQTRYHCLRAAKRIAASSWRAAKQTAASSCKEERAKRRKSPPTPECRSQLPPTMMEGRCDETNLRVRPVFPAAIRAGHACRRQHDRSGAGVDQNPNTPAPYRCSVPTFCPDAETKAGRSGEVTPPPPDTRAQTPIQRPVSPRIDQVKEQIRH